MSQYIHARIYPGKDDDLIAWLDGLPAGERSEAIREALRVGIGLLPPHESQQTILMATVREAVAKALEGAQITASEREAVMGTDELEQVFGTRLDTMLNELG